MTHSRTPLTDDPLGVDESRSPAGNPDWHGELVERAALRELVWPVLGTLAVPGIALGAYVLTGQPWALGLAFPTWYLVLWLDAHRFRQSRRYRAGRGAGGRRG